MVHLVDPVCLFFCDELLNCYTTEMLRTCQLLMKAYKYLHVLVTGLADVVGRRFGTQKIPYNRNKSIAGSVAMASAGFLSSIG